MVNASPVGAVLPEQPNARYSVPALAEYDEEGVAAPRSRCPIS